jgi:4-amino-4-deoxy-L-arabinose transferase-like glycosyltransferase
MMNDNHTKAYLMHRRDVLLVLGVFLLALLLRLSATWPGVTGERGFTMGDDDDYHRLAVSLVQSGRLEDSLLGVRAYRMPFFPMVLAAIYAVFGPTPPAAYVLLAVLSALTCVVIYGFGRQVFGPTVGLVAALLSCFDHGLIFYSQYLLTETVFVFLVVCGLWALDRLRLEIRWTKAVIAGCLLGLAVLTRVNMALCVPVALIWLVKVVRPQVKRALGHSLIVAGIVGGMWLTWVVRNYLVLGAFVPLTTQNGSGYYGVYNDITASASDLFHFGAWYDLALPPHPTNWTEVDLDRWQRGLAWNWIAAHPAAAFRITLSQALHFWQPGTLADVPYLLLILLSLLGIVQAQRRGLRTVELWAWLMLTLTLTAFVSLAVPRFQLVLHPFIDMTAAYALVSIVRQLGKRRSVGAGA